MSSLYVTSVLCLCHSVSSLYVTSVLCLCHSVSSLYVTSVLCLCHSVSSLYVTSVLCLCHTLSSVYASRRSSSVYVTPCLLFMLVVVRPLFMSLTVLFVCHSLSPSHKLPQSVTSRSLFMSPVLCPCQVLSLLLVVFCLCHVFFSCMCHCLSSVHVTGCPCVYHSLSSGYVFSMNLALVVFFFFFFFVVVPVRTTH